MKNRHRYGAPPLGLLLVAILGAGCGTSTLTPSAHNVSAVVTTTIAPTTTTSVPVTTTTVDLCANTTWPFDQSCGADTPTGQAIAACAVAGLANLLAGGPSPPASCLAPGQAPWTTTPQPTTTTPTIATTVPPTTTTTIGVSCVNYYGGAYLPTGTYLGEFQAGHGPSYGLPGSWYIAAGDGQSQVCTFQ